MGSNQDYVLELLGDRRMTVPEIVAEMGVPDYDKLHQRTKISRGLQGLEKYGFVTRETVGRKIYWMRREPNAC